MSAKNTKVLLVSGAVLLFVLLFIAPKMAAPAAEHAGNAPAQAQGKPMATNATVDMYLNQAVKSMAPELKQKLDQMLAAHQNDSAAALWDKLKRPDLASFYTEAQAQKENTAAAWFKAGNRYYYAVQFVQDKTELPVLYQCAMRCLNKGLAIEPNNSDARIMLASCYVEEGSDPMAGISRLREVEKTDSNNVKLQLAFAFFSVKSGQMDRAITRFNKVLAIDSNYIEAYLHLADAYEQQGETGKTIQALQQYAARTPDPMSRVEVNKYIQQLKNK